MYMQEVRRRARELATTDEREIPSGLVELLNAEDEVAEEFFSGVDKAAKPAERAYTAGDLRRNLERTRPQSLVVQRDSDARADVVDADGIRGGVDDSDGVAVADHGDGRRWGDWVGVQCGKDLAGFGGKDASGAVQDEEGLWRTCCAGEEVCDGTDDAPVDSTGIA